MPFPRVLFLDQSGKPGGAELCLLDIAKPLRDRGFVGLLADGDFRALLEQAQIPVQVLTNQAIQVRKESGLLKGLASLKTLLAPIGRTVQLSRDYDLIYANTPKALIVGAIASAISRRPLVYHLHDILSSEHFSSTNLQIAVTLANQFAALVIANSQATQAAFIAAGGRSDRSTVVYNGFEPQRYLQSTAHRTQLRAQLGVDQQFVIGHFSRLSPWKGQHVLIEALKDCPDHAIALLVGDALFGEQDYVEQLHRQVAEHGLENRVRFLGFRSDVPELMAACDVVAHTSTAPEPFGRVIVEAMLAQTPIIAAAAGGAVELVEPGKTGWLVPPNDPDQLAMMIRQCCEQSQQARATAAHAQVIAAQRFSVTQTNQQIHCLLQQLVRDRPNPRDLTATYRVD